MITDVLNSIDSFVWGPPLLVLLIGTGLMLTIRLQLIQFFKLPQALKLIFTAENKGDGDIDSFKALCTALAATVGTGNIVGVATAIHAGGPGAVFWMWIAAFVGMATKYAEGCLAVKFRTTDENGDIAGGPMYYIERGLGEKFKPLAKLFAIFGVLVAFFGIGTFAQVNSIVEITKLATDIPVEYTAVVLTVLVAAVTIGGLQSISRAAAKIVPVMAVLYIAVTVVFLIIFREQVPSAIMQIITDAFTPTAAVGGFAGATVMLAMRNGVARGVFSNESGLGSAPIVAAAAKTKWSAEQGLVSMTGTFIDTLIICTLTGLTILVTGVWNSDLNGVALTQSAFSTVFSHFGPALLTIFLVLFAFTTILGWNYYGERCFEFLFGVRFIWLYRVVFVLMVLLGGFIELDMVWIIADIVNALMALPNLIALLVLSPVVIAETKKYFNK